ncbi:hypothetical protein SCAB_60671 [Streptomyces scabiei 87.22]|uniref:Uncharacterized protein n=1 Tax=Streptomyces scabiei (strain 87.22) TaxID=680198 RepID=C9Z8Z7_STRSW|nr:MULTISPECIES: hypothetical protein [Streptomyces]MBP5875704.1 hypothetical protein [Streptomyces sp. LBUM 1477]MDX2652163.1 hypothetical protein [Streptomyces scabiei]MDX2725811.1 hypothetical protein [Streptomyces scabiei]MDX2863930.1 hypothetical protein [Streptomyces scabiei]MDX2881854.1 hypothetical protein [Streptomyces scabiei]
MSIPERTGRARAGRGCRWCGQKAETVKYEVRDSGTPGSEVMCLTCGKHQYRWGWEKRFWAEETRRELARWVLVTAWLAGQIIRLAAPPEPMSPAQAAWIREHVWTGFRLRNHNHIPSTTFACACQGAPSCECQRDQHAGCRHDGHPVNETVIHTSRGRAARFPEPYEHRAPAGGNGRRIAYGTNNDVAWVWLAGRPCREICTCVCHRPHSSVPAAPVRTEQLDLFAGLP